MNTDGRLLNFQEAHALVRESDLSFEPDTKKVYEADMQYQNEIGARGGTVTTNLTPEAEEALQRISERRQAARRKILRPYIEAGRAEHARLISELAPAADHFLDLGARTANFEAGFNHLLRLADEPAQTAVAVGDRTDAAAVLDRLQRLEARRVADAKPRRASVALPSFADLLR
ncbi:MAG TPA: hypothetical protein VFD27_20780 [Chthoniobacteraceae bacterium]|nr:hypothetical protein [Chthoniobacteraceae bacterium]